MITAIVFLIQRGEPFINPAGHSFAGGLSGAGPWSLDAWLFGRNENGVDTGRVASRVSLGSKGEHSQRSKNALTRS